MSNTNSLKEFWLWRKKVKMLNKNAMLMSNNFWSKCLEISGITLIFMKEDGSKDFESFSKPNDLLDPDLIDIFTTFYQSVELKKKKKWFWKLIVVKILRNIWWIKNTKNRLNMSQSNVCWWKKIYKRETFVSKGSMAFKQEIMGYKIYFFVPDVLRSINVN